MANLVRPKINEWEELVRQDKVLIKFEMLRRYYFGESPCNFCEDYGYAVSGFYTIHNQFKEKGWKALIDKRGGAYHVKRTEEVDKETIVLKVINPDRSNESIAEELRSRGIADISTRTVDRVLEDHGLNNLKKTTQKQIKKVLSH